MQCCKWIVLWTLGLGFAAEEDRWLAELEGAMKVSLRGEHRTAASILERLVREAEELGWADMRFAVALHNLANAQHECGRYLEAERNYNRAIQALDGPENPRVAPLLRAMNNLTTLYIETGQLGKADRTLRRLGEILDTCQDRYPEDLAVFRNQSASVPMWRGRHREAGMLLGQALDDARRQLGPSSPEVASLLNSRGLLMSRTHRWEEAAADLESALPALERAHGSSHPAVARVQVNLAGAYRELGKVHRALELADRALAAAESALGPDHPVVAAALLERAAALRRCRRGKEARALERRAHDILRKRDGENFLGATVDIGVLAIRPRK